MNVRKNSSIIFLLILLVVLSIVSSTPLAKAAEAPLTEWNKDYTSLRGMGASVIQTKDGGYAVGGVSDGEFLLLKTNSYGDIQWTKTYGAGVAFSVVQTSDGGYALAGNGTLFDLVKTDSNGNVEWNKTYGETAGSFAVRSLIQTSDGGYALAGWNSARINWFGKTDANGNMQWNKTYADGRTNSTINTIIEANDGGYTIAVGTFGAPSPQTMLIKTDSNGNVQWNVTFPSPHYQSLAKTIDGGYLLAGANSLLKTDSQGKTQWIKYYGVGESPTISSFWTVVQTHDGGFVATALTFGLTSDFNETGAQVVKTDSMGNIEWNVTYPPIAGKSNRATSIIEVENGKYVFTGSIGASTGIGYVGDVWLVKVAPPPDITPPTVFILSPKNKAYTQNNVYLTFSVSESTSWVKYSLDGQANATVTGNTTLTELSDGTHSIVAYASDLAGNTGCSDIVYFSIETAAPSISILSPENKTYDKPNIPLTFAISEAVSWMGYSLNGQANVTIIGNATVPELADGSYNIIVYAEDAAGNKATSETVYFSIKTQQPGFSLPIEYGYVIVVATLMVIAFVAGYSFFRRRKSPTTTAPIITATVSEG